MKESKLEVRTGQKQTDIYLKADVMKKNIKCLYRITIR